MSNEKMREELASKTFESVLKDCGKKCDHNKNMAYEKFNKCMGKGEMKMHKFGM